MADKVELDTKSIELFADELGKLLKQYGSKGYLSKESKTHQKNLEALMENTNKILKGKADSADFAKFDDLLANTELSYKLMKEQHENDKKFKDQYVEVFGQFEQSNSFNQRMMSRIKVSLESVSKSVDVISGQFKKDVKDTSLSWLTGPFGQMMTEAVDASGVKQAWEDRKARKQEQADAFNNAFQSTEAGVSSSIMDQAGADIAKKREANNAGGGKIKGQAHGGMKKIPSEGTYMLDGGERVLSPEENTDLTGFLKGGKLDVFNIGHSEDYFSPIIDHDEQMFRDDNDMSKKEHKEIKEKFDILGDALARERLLWMQASYLRWNIFWKRFERHPIITSLSLLSSVGIKLFKGMATVVGAVALLRKGWGMLTNVWRGFFGFNPRNDTEKIVQSNEDIANILEKGQKVDRRGSLFKWENSPVLKALFGETTGGPKSRMGQYSLVKQVDFLEDIRDILYEAFGKQAGIRKKKEDKKSKIDGMLTGMMQGITSAITSGMASMAGSIGSILFKILKKYGLGAAGVGAKGAMLFGAFEIGDWVGKNIITPLLDELGKLFNVDLLGGIGKIVYEFVKLLEQLPVIGPVVKKLTGDLSGQEEKSTMYQYKVARDAKAKIEARQATPAANTTMLGSMLKGYEDIGGPASGITGMLERSAAQIKLSNPSKAMAKYVDDKGYIKGAGSQDPKDVAFVKEAVKALAGEIAKVSKPDSSGVMHKPAIEDMNTYLLINFQ